MERYHQLEEGQNEWHKKYESKCRLHPVAALLNNPLMLCVVAAERSKLTEMEGKQQVKDEQLEEATCKVCA